MNDEKEREKEKKKIEAEKESILENNEMQCVGVHEMMFSFPFPQSHSFPLSVCNDKESKTPHSRSHRYGKALQSSRKKGRTIHRVRAWNHLWVWVTW